MSQNPYETPDGLAVPYVKPATSKSGWSRRLLIIGGLLLFAVVVIGMTLPFNRSGTENIRKGTENIRTVACSNYVRQLGLALLSYESGNGRFPPVYTVDENGRPLHSWRAVILPYIEENAVHKLIDFSKPWDDLVNRKAYETDLEAFRCPESNAPNGFTTYLALVTPNSCLRPEESCAPADIKDGVSNTVTIVEGGFWNAVHWMSPVDADEELFLRIGESEIESPHIGGFNAANADGSVRFLPNNTPAAVRRALISVAGDDNEMLDE